MLYKNLVNNIYSAIVAISDGVVGIEKYVGKRTSLDVSTISGKLNTLVIPKYEEQPILENNTFITTQIPVNIGAWCVDDTCWITEEDGLMPRGATYDTEKDLWVLEVEDEGDIILEGTVKVTYYYKPV
jgi:hypothetical protein